MYSIAFSLQKGGVGKTSLSGNIAIIKAKHHRVLLVDADPQGSITSWLCQNQGVKFELADVLQGKASLQESIVSMNYEGLEIDILPTFSIGGDLKLYSETKLEREPYIFSDFLEEAEKMKYEYVFFDLSPSMGRLERCILLAVDEAISPLSPEYLSIDGIEIFQAFLDEIKKGFKKTVKHDKILINMINESFRRHKTYRDMITELKGYTVFQVPQDKNIPEAQTMHTPLHMYEPASRALQALETIAEAL